MKEHHVCEKDYTWNTAIHTCEDSKYLGSITDDSVIIYDEIIEATKTVPTKVIPTKSTLYRVKDFYFLHTFLLITLALLIAVNIYCYLKKYSEKKTIIIISQHQ